MICIVLFGLKLISIDEAIGLARVRKEEQEAAITETNRASIGVRACQQNRTNINCFDQCGRGFWHSQVYSFGVQDKQEEAMKMTPAQPPWADRNTQRGTTLL